MDQGDAECWEKFRPSAHVHAGSLDVSMLNVCAVTKFCLSKSVRLPLVKHHESPSGSVAIDVAPTVWSLPQAGVGLVWGRHTCCQCQSLAVSAGAKINLKQGQIKRTES